MTDIPITIGAIVLTVIGIIVIPVITMADRFDTTSQAEAEAIVSDFFEEAITTAQITETKYSQFLENLNSLGYIFDVEMEIKNIDENQSKKTSQTSNDKLGENVYYSEYTSQIEEELEKYGIKKLQPGDILLIEVRKESSDLFKNLVYKIFGNGAVSKAGMVQ